MTIILSREELYREVWRRPTLALARSYGLSDVALAKLCRRRHIPRPARGHWTLLEMGCPRAIPPLPPAQPGDDRPVVIDTEANFARRAQRAA